MFLLNFFSCLKHSLHWKLKAEVKLVSAFKQGLPHIVVIYIRNGIYIIFISLKKIQAIKDTEGSEKNCISFKF